MAPGEFRRRPVRGHEVTDEGEAHRVTERSEARRPVGEIAVVIRVTSNSSPACHRPSMPSCANSFKNN